MIKITDRRQYLHKLIGTCSFWFGKKENKPLKIIGISQKATGIERTLPWHAKESKSVIEKDKIMSCASQCAPH